MQIKNIKVRDSKFGLALVIESSESSGGYVLGFRVDPVEKLNIVFEELNNLYQIHALNPEFGVYQILNLLGISMSIHQQSEKAILYCDQLAGLENSNRANAQSMGTYQEVVDCNENVQGKSFFDPVLAYLAEGECSELRPHQWTYDPSIGISIEKIKDGFSIESLWEVVENLFLSTK